MWMTMILILGNQSQDKCNKCYPHLTVPLHRLYNSGVPPEERKSLQPYFTLWAVHVGYVLGQELATSG